MRRSQQRTAGWAVLLLVSGVIMACVSRSIPGERFEQSNKLPALDFNVTLPDPNNFSFAIVGDLHIANRNTERLRTILTDAAAEGDAFVVPLGDIVDQGGQEDFAAVNTTLSDLGFAKKSLPVIGNHDIFGDGWTHFSKLQGPSHYSVTVGNSRFIAVDSADGSINEAEAEWLREELKKKGATHTFVLSHYLPVIPGVRTYLKIANEEESSRLMKMASVGGVTAWLGAHYHSYIVENVEGVTYVVAGGGGGRRMGPVEAFFFVQVQVAGTSVSYHFRQVP